MDPYVVIETRQQKFRTVTKQGAGKTPVWNQVSVKDFVMFLIALWYRSKIHRWWHDSLCFWWWCWKRWQSWFKRDQTFLLVCKWWPWRMVLGPTQRKKLWVSPSQGTLASSRCWCCSWWKTNYCHCYTITTSWLCCSLGLRTSYDAVLSTTRDAATNGLRTRYDAILSTTRDAATNGLCTATRLWCTAADVTTNGLCPTSRLCHAAADGLPTTHAATHGLPTANATTNATAYGLPTVPRAIANVRTATLIQMKIV